MASSIVGWYGPLIDLSKANLHVGDFVQLLAFVHNSNPIQYKSWKGDTARRDILVGDDTRPFFPLTLWPNHLGSSIPVSGDVILLQNVKIAKYGDVLEGKTVHCSSMLPLIHPDHHSLLSKGLDELVSECRVGRAAKEKLKKVIEWLKQSGSSFSSVQSHCHHLVTRNWKLPEERESKDCFSVSEVALLTEPCKAAFFASVTEIFLPFDSTDNGESEKENMFLSRRVHRSGETRLAADLVCTGCRLCGFPLNSEQKCNVEQGDGEAPPLYCSESPNRLHVVSFIYRPFMLYVWDESEYMTILVRNKAAELLFGNIKAEQVYTTFIGQQNPKDLTQLSTMSLGFKRKLSYVNGMNFHLIWLILLKALMQRGKNSPLKFEVNVNTSLDRESGRFQMVSVWMPCFQTQVSLYQNVSLEK